MLAAIVCGLLTGARGYKAIAQWTRVQSVSVCHLLGFQRRPPCANSLRNLLLALSPEVLEDVLRQWTTSIVEQPLPDDARGTALDGKTLCNTLAAHGAMCICYRATFLTTEIQYAISSLPRERGGTEILLDRCTGTGVSKAIIGFAT